jgi:hypothetical protein
VSVVVAERDRDGLGYFLSAELWGSTCLHAVRKNGRTIAHTPIMASCDGGINTGWGWAVEIRPRPRVDDRMGTIYGR